MSLTSLIALTFSAMTFASGAPAADPTASGALDLTIPHEKYILAQNGLEVILARDPSLPIAAVNIWYHAGPINEPPRRTGFAHLFEHLMFQGSANVGDDSHFKLLEAAGASLINGTTDYDRTNYFETVPANQLELALWLESDRMGFLRGTLTQDKLDNQRDVVMNERRQSIENVPYGPSGEALVQHLFPASHPYFGYVIGSMDDLAAATLDDVHDFAARYYAPANATLVIAGDFDPASVKKWVAKYFGTLERRPPPPRITKITTPPITKPRRARIEEPVSLPQLRLAWLSAPAYAKGDAECDVLAFIAGAGHSSRLYQRLVYDLQIAQDVAASQESLTLQSIFTVTVTGRPGGDLERLERETVKVLEELRRTPPEPREVLRAKNMLTTHHVAALQTIGGFGGVADMLNRYNQLVGRPDYLQEDLARYERVTPAAVQALAANLLDPQHGVVVTTVPTP